MGYDSRASKDYLCRAFFDVLASVETSVSTSENQEEISYKGLDVVKEEITAEVTSKINKECKEALAFKQANKDLAKLHKENETEIIPKLNKEIEKLEKKLIKACADLAEVSKETKNIETELSAYKELISKILKKVLSTTFFTRKLTLSVIVTYINNIRLKYENKN